MIPTRKKALIVDDSVTMRSMLTMVLGQAGFEVVEAKNGLEGLGALGGCSFDVIISDLHMPEMNGLEFIRCVRKTREGRGVPILVLTTEAGQAKKLEGKEAGATGWLVKPFEPATFLKTLARVMP